jgi:hypothetical protein
LPGNSNSFPRNVKRTLFVDRCYGEVQTGAFSL